jgi:hypothetical protein
MATNKRKQTAKSAKRRRALGPVSRGEQIWPPEWHTAEDQEKAERARQNSARRDEELAEREASIAKFAEEQRRKREWINFAEIAESCARRGNPFVADEAARSGAYDRLRDDLLAGDFEENGKSMVRFLNARSKGEWVSRRRMHDLEYEAAISLSDAIDTFSPEDIRSQYLVYCWIPRQMYRRWETKYGLSPTPWFEPQERCQTESETHNVDRSLASSSPPNVRRRGKKPTKLVSTTERMRLEIRDGLRSVEGLRTMLEKDLGAEYHVSRDTARKARNKVLSEFVENSISTNDK